MEGLPPSTTMREAPLVQAVSVAGLEPYHNATLSRYMHADLLAHSSRCLTMAEHLHSCILAQEWHELAHSSSGWNERQHFVISCDALLLS